MNNMFGFYLQLWLNIWLTDETKAGLSHEWDDKGHPSIVPVDKIKRF